VLAAGLGTRFNGWAGWKLGFEIKMGGGIAWTGVRNQVTCSLLYLEAIYDTAQFLCSKHVSSSSSSTARKRGARGSRWKSSTIFHVSGAPVGLYTRKSMM
jgi:hypothetical protein